MNDLETTLGRVLRVGVTLSTIALVAGLGVAAFAGGGPPATRLLTIGVLLLIATPVARVVVSALAYLQKRDWTFALLTLIVLCELIASIVAAVRGN